jgi:thiamine-monophosphate kinase
VNLSDVAAMAGVPRFATVSLCLPADLPLAFLDGLYDGLLERAAEAGMYLIGGNISATEGPMVIDVTLLGMGERLLRRAGALPGDVAVVTGSLGAAAEGLRLLREGARLAPDGSLETPGLWSEASGDAVAACLRAQLDPVPPIAFACALAEHEIAHAGIDISDGLSGDLLALCQESGVRAFLDPAGVPVDPSAAALEAARGGDALELAMHGGEDYQLLLAVPPERLQSLRDIAVVWELPLSVVGQFHEGEAGVDFRTAEGAAPLAPLSHEHFRAGLRGCPPPAST